MSTQRVNEAVAIAVRRILESKGDVVNRHALGQSIGKRIAGTYGAELRQLADKHPDADAQVLFKAVILPGEFPWESDAAESAMAELNLAARKRARRDLPPVDLDIPIPPNISQLVAQAKTAAKVGFAAQQERKGPEPRQIVRGVIVPKFVWQALDHPSTRRTQDA